MSHQKHDIGHQKRRYKPQEATESINGETLARKLVERGLASPFILTKYNRPANTKQEN